MAGWGVAYVPSAWLVEDVPPLLAAALRLSLAGGLLLAVMVLSGRSLHPEVGWGVVAWIGFTQTTLFYGATFWGLDREGAGLAAVLANTDPLFVAVLSSWLLGEVLRGGQWLGLVVGFLGTALAVSHQQVWPPTASVDSLIVVGGALAWSIGTVVAARQVRGVGDPLGLAGWQMLVGGVMLGGVVAFDPGPVTFGAPQMGLVVLVAVVGSAVPLALFYRALTMAPASAVSAWFFLVPVIGVATAWPLLDERPTPTLGVGLALVSGGLWLVMRDSAGDEIASIGRDSMAATPPDSTRQ